MWIGLDARRDFLLDSPLANGTWGIYRGPAINAGLVDESDRLPLVEANQVRRHTLVVKWLFGPIAQALQHPSEQVYIVRKRSSNLQELANILELLPQRRYLREVFVKPKDAPLTRTLADLALQDPEEPIERLLTRAIRELDDPKFRATLHNIKSCERYIASMDILFERLARNAGQSAKELAASFALDMDALRAAQVDFIKAGGIYKGLAQERQSRLASAPLHSLHSLIDFLIAHHNSISAARKTVPLLFWGDTNQLESVLTLEPREESRSMRIARGATTTTLIRCGIWRCGREGRLNDGRPAALGASCGPFRYH